MCSTKLSCKNTTTGTPIRSTCRRSRRDTHNQLNARESHKQRYARHQLINFMVKS